MRIRWVAIYAVLLFLLAATTALLQVSAEGRAPAQSLSAYGQNADAATDQNVKALLEEGKKIFRFDTFGDEVFWGDQLQLHLGIAGEKNGGVGGGLSPKAALAAGLKVDMEALPAALVEQVKANKVDLDDPATTLALLKLNAVVGVTGFFDGDKLKSVGIQCALCHSTVDDAFAPGIGRRLDGWPNRDLNVGAVILLSANPKPFMDLLRVDAETLKKVLTSWGPGKFDAELNLDGKAFRPDGKPAATLIPFAFGLAGVNNHTWTGGWGTVSYWNAYVANLEMGGQGNFYDTRLDNASQYPVAARAKLGHKKSEVDMVTSKLPALHFYQLALPAPRPPDGSFNAEAAKRGAAIFNAKAKCAACHVPPLFTEPGNNLHKPEDIGIDAFQSSRSPERLYRTAPLRALWSMDKIHKGGFYHDGRFATLKDVVAHYNTFFKLALTEAEVNDLIEYLKSI